jgi:hypothetical protein
MKHRFTPLYGLLLVISVNVTYAAAQAPSPTELTIVMAVSVAPEAAPDKVREALRAIPAQLRAQPGAIDDLVLENTLSTARPRYLLVMRWQRQKDWENMLANRPLWESLNSHRSLFTLERATIFTQLE